MSELDFSDDISESINWSELSPRSSYFSEHEKPFQVYQVPNVKIKNCSFSDFRIQQIQWHNNILSDRINSAKSTLKINRDMNTSIRLSSSAINRKKRQQKIDHENDILSRKLASINRRRDSCS